MVEKVRGTLFSSAGVCNIPVLFVLFFFWSTSNAQTGIRMINVPGGPVILQRVIDSIESGSGLHTHWPKGVLDPNKVVLGTGRRMLLIDALRMYLGGEGLSWKIEGTTIFVEQKYSAARYVRAAIADLFRAITVVVIDESGVGLANANLQIVRTGQFLQTGADGKASILSAIFGDTIYCSYAGKRMEKFIVHNSRTEHVVLRDQTFVSDTIVVTPYVHQPKDGYTGNVIDVIRRQIASEPVSNPQAALAGRVAGVMVTQSNGVYGSNYDIIFRGKTSILNGHAPLYIIDGVPFAPGSTSVSNIRTGNAGFGLNPLSFIDKDNIEKMQVLKDADATAIYGSRGANGVIIITTRKHTSGNSGLSMGIEKGIGMVTRLPRMMGIRDYTRMRLDALQYDKLTPSASNAPELTKWDTTRNVDWQKVFVRGIGIITKAHAGVSGGNRQNEWFFGANWLREANVFIDHPAHDLFSWTGSMSHRSIDQRLNTDVYILAGWDKNAQFTSDVSRLQFLVPNAPALLDKNGKPVYEYNGVTFSNPYSIIGDRYSARSHNYLVSSNIEYRLWDHLTIKMTTGVDDVQTEEFGIDPGWNQNPAYKPVRSSYLANEHFRSWIIEPRLEYGVSLKEWKINLLAGGSWQGQRSVYRTLSAYGFSNDSLLASPSMADSVSREDILNDYIYTAWFSQLTAGWKGRWMLNLSGRRDGSSRFPNNRRYGNFGAIGLSWTFSEEPFFQRSLPFISFGKLRTSYGITGNDGIGGGQGYLEDWSQGAGLNYQSSSNVSSGARVLPDVSWEHVRKTEVSIDWGFLKKRISLIATWYMDRSDHQLLPDSFQTFDNIIRLHNRPVVLQNTGWEFSLTSINIRNDQASWTTSINFSIPHNKLVAFPGISTSPFSDLVVGQSLSALRAYSIKGIDQKSGVFVFNDLNGDDTVTSDDRSMIIQPRVRFFGGLENTITLHNWQIDVLLEFRSQSGIGYQAALYASNRPGSIVSGLYSNETIDMVNHWQRPGDPGPYQVLTTKGTSEAGRAISRYLSSDGILTDASYLRLKSLSVSYSVPRLFGMAKGKVFVQGSNLLTMTSYKGVDPESQSVLALPPLRTITAGVELTL